MALRDVLGRLVVEDGLGRLNCHEQLAPLEQEQVPRSRAAPGVPARALATLASVSLRLPRALATPRAPGHLPHAIAAPRVPRACPRPRALATPRAPGHVPHALAAPRVPRVPCIRQGHAADAGAREAMRTSRDARDVVVTVAGASTGPADPRRLWCRESGIGCRLPLLQCGVAHRHRQRARLCVLGENSLERATLAEVERRRAGIAAVSTDGGAAAIWSAAHRAVA